MNKFIRWILRVETDYPNWAKTWHLGRWSIEIEWVALADYYTISVWDESKQ